MICLFCKKWINNPHGNRKHHSECTKKKKRKRSSMRYAILAMSYNQYWNSERLLRNAYNEDEPNKEHDIIELINEGLDIKNYQSKKTINGRTIYVYIKHGFYHLTSNKIIICKM